MSVGIILKLSEDDDDSDDFDDSDDSDDFEEPDASMVGVKAAFAVISSLS